MIKLMTKGHYGTKLMLNLASRYKVDGDATVLKRISEEEEISLRYLEQIIIPLKINRLVKSVRGAGGGYTLARDPSKISVLEILDALDGPCYLTECVEDPSVCEQTSSCAAHEVWKGATLLLKNYFESFSLTDLLEMSEKKLKKARSH